VAGTPLRSKREGSGLDAADDRTTLDGRSHGDSAAIKDKSARKQRSCDLMAQGLDLQTQQRASNTTRMRPPDAQLALGLRSGVRYVGHS